MIHRKKRIERPALQKPKGDNNADAVDRMQAVPLYHQIFMQLREEITSGERAHGSRMPTEQELAASYGVSRITARRALAELADANLVARQRRVGTTVIFETPVRPFQGNLDTALESLLNFGRSTQVRLLELETVPARPPISDALQVAPETPVVRVVRVRWLEDKPLGYFISFIPASLGVSLTRTALKTTPMLQLIEEAGVRIGAATQTISATLADSVLSAALGVDIGSPILRVSRTVFDKDGRPVQHILAQFRHDRYQIKLDLNSARMEPQII
ncbi:MAG: GntR family transcriptional regulator [Rhizomicrobium sp.]